MTLVFVAKDLQVANPVGMVNVHPLPSLPSGLSRAHLLRRSLVAMNINLVDGTQGEFTEVRTYGGSDGTFSYDDVSIHSDWGANGWLDLSWEIPYSTTGVTWMAVAQVSADIHRLISSADAASVAGSFHAMHIRTEEQDLRVGGTNIGYTGTSYVPLPVERAMFFSSVHGGDLTRAAYVPHLDSYNSAAFSDDGALDPVDGVFLAGVRISTAQEPRDIRLYMVAQWDRVLDQSEMAAAYAALKPWLAARGVVIA